MGGGGKYHIYDSYPYPYINASYRYQNKAFFGRGGFYFIMMGEKSGNMNILWPGVSLGVAF